MLICAPQRHTPCAYAIICRDRPERCTRGRAAAHGTTMFDAVLAHKIYAYTRTRCQTRQLRGCATRLPRRRVITQRQKEAVRGARGAARYASGDPNILRPCRRPYARMQATQTYHHARAAAKQHVAATIRAMMSPMRGAQKRDKEQVRSKHAVTCASQVKERSV